MPTLAYLLEIYPIRNWYESARNKYPREKAIRNISYKELIHPLNSFAGPSMKIRNISYKELILS